MAKQINVIVTSTRRKRAAVPAELCLRNLADLDLDERVVQWTLRLESFEGRRVKSQDFVAQQN